MARRRPGWTLSELADRLGATLEGPDGPAARPSAAGDDDPEGVTFAQDERYLTKALEGRFAAILLPPGLECDQTVLRHPRPRQAFMALLTLADRPMPLAEGIHPTAVVDPLASVAPTAKVGPYAVIEAGAVVRDRARVYAFAYVGEDCVVGEGSMLFPHAVLVRDVTLEAGVTIHSGAVIGADGFGYSWNGTRHIKIPQVGGVRIGPASEVGANATIDRATAGATTLGEDVKVDNLVQIAHNCRLEDHVILASQVGLAGSVTVETGAVLGGQVGTGDHVTIGAGARVGGQGGVVGDLAPGKTYWGTPARPKGETMRTLARTGRLAETEARLKELERRLAELEKKL
ncbi:UDP-3-O-(3-hydroxymyristoyl)glucosamine N-acyltransferase [bacterium]|nr:MAG: UDP-3-O-(3-hydroxymyristoyl)glucosamine N-acyltransferase [bacterium]